MIQFNWCITNVYILIVDSHILIVGSYIDSPGWIKKKGSTINPKNTDDKFFQYTATVALNNEEFESHPERVSSIKPFISKYNR